jgi:hypothetical protein
MPRPPGVDYRPRMQRALFQGLVKDARRKGLTLSEYFAEKWAEDWKAAAGILIKFFPTNVNIKGHIEHLHSAGQLSQTLEFLEISLGTGEGETFEELGEIRSLLPAEISTETPGHAKTLVIPEMPGSPEEP